MAKKGHKKGKSKKNGFKWWWLTLAGAIACWALVIVFYALMYQAILSFEVDLGDDPNLMSAIFGSIFGTIGAYAGIAGLYSEWMTIFFWAAIVLTASTIVLAILQHRRKK